MKAVKTLILSGIVMFFFLASTSDVNAQDVKKQEGCKKQQESDDVFLVVQEMPQFKNGDLKTFRKWVADNIKYPKEAMKDGISGTVNCEFVINEDGSVDRIKIQKPVNKLLGDEVVRVVKSSPKWSPGMQKGQKVPVRMNIPISFKLD